MLFNEGRKYESRKNLFCRRQSRLWRSFNVLPDFLEFVRAKKLSKTWNFFFPWVPLRAKSHFDAFESSQVFCCSAQPSAKNPANNCRKKSIGPVSFTIWRLRFFVTRENLNFTSCFIIPRHYLSLRARKVRLFCSIIKTLSLGERRRVISARD